MKKSIIHHYLTKNTNTAVIIIDPHGDIARQVGQFKENVKNDRIVFIGSHFVKNQTPVMNPFDIPQKYLKDDLLFEIYSKQVIEGIGASLGKNNQLTDQMMTLLDPCVKTLLRLPNTSMEHLKQFFDPERNEILLREGEKHLTNPNAFEFIRDLSESGYAQTRLSIKTRLNNLLNSDSFRNFMVGSSTFDIEKAINQKKVIIFSLPSYGAKTNSPNIAIGRLILSQILGIAMKRELLTKEQREFATPIHLFIDEAHNFAIPSMAHILSEARKYRCHMTLASQFIDQFSNEGDTPIKKAIETNTYTKITGFQPTTSSAVSTAKLVGSSTEALARLPLGHFHIKVGEMRGFIAKNKSRLIDDSHAMKNEQWEAIKKNQVEHYYRKVQTPAEAKASYQYSPVPTKTKKTALPNNRKFN